MRKDLRKYLKKKIAKNFLNVEKEMVTQIREGEVLGTINPARNTPDTW